MEYKEFNNKYVLRLEKGEEVVKTLKDFCKENEIYAGSIKALGACDFIKVGYFDINKKEYFSKDFNGSLEVAFLYGNISKKDDEVYLHFHITFGDEEFNSYSGHLNEAIVSATFEVEIIKENVHLDRKFSEEIGLNLYKFD